MLPSSQNTSASCLHEPEWSREAPTSPTGAGSVPLSDSMPKHGEHQEQYGSLSSASPPLAGSCLSGASLPAPAAGARKWQPARPALPCSTETGGEAGLWRLLSRKYCQAALAPTSALRLACALSTWLHRRSACSPKATKARSTSSSQEAPSLLEACLRLVGPGGPWGWCSPSACLAASWPELRSSVRMSPALTMVGRLALPCQEGVLCLMEAAAEDFRTFIQLGFRGLAPAASGGGEPELASRRPAPRGTSPPSP
mmetsp:Transcript_2466/g.6637  ORF Transcript_2466/g.6637 Transcript_2466/m.6637 type:complete len:255 (+) Transcript_2466:293-1057(+)